ncbi:conserved hypothetical protein [Verticillium alfalfae VaMs.102]|uniref:Zn(2)-C6 fungal-type domain-containing protein n=1 Tax=Verticillium alfalfae (strain VaMs.102 / ATCC MYA-4576 / FGSC 10136) TaxID=526221 RepID=C9SG18_VERA1|nr:conserved hypothetical protein [Verticillium alfalfae VaMs.102]EEY17422.1 conserved hypothetical protein [Verticillium alfalfae VaMs.102]
METSSAGCWTCKLRHRKCDAATPACAECDDRGIPCYGYGMKPSWMDGGAMEVKELTRIKKAVKQHCQDVRKARNNAQQLRKAAVQRSRQYSSRRRDDTQTNKSSSVFRPQMASTLMYYLDHVFAWLYPYFDFHSSLGDRGWLLSTLGNGGPLYQAAIALSALHQSAVPDRRTEQILRNQRAVHHHSQALRELRELSRNTGSRFSDNAQRVEFIASGLTLISYEILRADSKAYIFSQVFNGAEYDWLPHLNAVTGVVRELEPGLEHGAESPDFQSVHDFLIGETLWYDILACVSTDRAPRLSYRRWLEGATFDMANLMGCHTWAVTCIGDLAHLQEDTRSTYLDETINSSAVAVRAQRIEQRLREGAATLTLHTEAPMSAWITRVFSLAAIALSRTIGIRPSGSNSEVFGIISESINILGAWPRSISLQGLVWPLCIIGCMAEGDQQTFLEDLLNNYVKDTGEAGNGVTILRIIRDCWKAERYPGWDWRDTAFRSRPRVLLI